MYTSLTTFERGVSPLVWKIGMTYLKFKIATSGPKTKGGKQKQLLDFKFLAQQVGLESQKTELVSTEWTFE